MGAADQSNTDVLPVLAACACAFGVGAVLAIGSSSFTMFPSTILTIVPRYGRTLRGAPPDKVQPLPTYEGTLEQDTA